MTTSPGRERIMEAAMQLFADRGVDGVTVRDIAAKAEVSPALIVHHFGSKEGLRGEVNSAVAGIVDGLREGALGELTDSVAPAASFAELFLLHLPPDSPVPAYMRRMLLDGDPAGTEIFRQWFALSQEVLTAMTEAGVAKPSADPQVRAAFLMINDFALVLLHEHLDSVLGFDPLTHAGLTRWSTDVLDAYTHGAFTSPDTSERNTP